MTRQSFKVKPVYMVFLILAVVFYVASVCAIHADLYKKVCTLEHQLMHMQNANDARCPKTK